MSTLKVDTLNGSTGSTITVPSGQTLAVAGTLTTTGTFNPTADISVTGNISNDGVQIIDNTISASRTNDDLEISASGTGKVKIGVLKFPTSDGSSDQVLKTDGSGKGAPGRSRRQSHRFYPLLHGRSLETPLGQGHALRAEDGRGRQGAPLPLRAFLLLVPRPRLQGDDGGLPRRRHSRVVHDPHRLPTPHPLRRLPVRSRHHPQHAQAAEGQQGARRDLDEARVQGRPERAVQEPQEPVGPRHRRGDLGGVERRGGAACWLTMERSRPRSGRRTPPAGGVVGSTRLAGQ